MAKFDTMRTEVIEKESRTCTLKVTPKEFARVSCAAHMLKISGVRDKVTGREASTGTIMRDQVAAGEVEVVGYDVEVALDNGWLPNTEQHRLCLPRSATLNLGDMLQDAGPGKNRTQGVNGRHDFTSAGPGHRSAAPQPDPLSHSRASSGQKNASHSLKTPLTHTHATQANTEPGT